MFKKYILSVFILILSLNVQGQSVKTTDSKVEFSVSSMGFKTVKGTFSGMKGDVAINTNDLSVSNIEVCIDANTVNTDSEKRDAHLKNEDFFDVEKYPTICFKSTDITKTSVGYKTKGILTMHGVSKTVEIPFTYQNNKISGSISLKRKDYGIGEDYGGFMVGKSIDIKIICVVN